MSDPMVEPVKRDMTSPVYVLRGGVYLLDEHAGVLVDSAGNFSAKTKGDPRALVVLLRAIADAIADDLESADPVHPPMPVGHIRACGCPECVAWLEAHEPAERCSMCRDGVSHSARCHHDEHEVCDRVAEGTDAPKSCACPCHSPADLVQGDAKLRENSGDADATENHADGGK